MRSIIFAIVMLALLGMNVVACNTVHGIGQDVERAGEKTQDAADNVKKKL
jgi:predicted small secreted protein